MALSEWLFSKGYFYQSGVFCYDDIRPFAPRLKDRSSAAVAKNSYRVSRRANNPPPASLWRDGRSVAPSSVKCLLFFAEREQGEGVGVEIQAAKLLMPMPD